MGRERVCESSLSSTCAAPSTAPPRLRLVVGNAAAHEDDDAAMLTGAPLPRAGRGVLHAPTPPPLPSAVSPATRPSQRGDEVRSVRGAALAPGAAKSGRAVARCVALRCSRRCSSGRGRRAGGRRGGRPSVLGPDACCASALSPEGAYDPGLGERSLARRRASSRRCGALAGASSFSSLAPVGLCQAGRRRQGARARCRSSSGRRRHPRSS
eukprot:scaffold685_cov324-Prasinococcus_capsulatus_cf.AAC.13